MIYTGRPFMGLQSLTTSNENHVILRRICVDHGIVLLHHLSTHMHFITNGYKRFYRPTRLIQGNVFL